jgi:hypothetical protein
MRAPGNRECLGQCGCVPGIALIGLAATATVIAAPFTIASASAQKFPLLEELDLTDETTSNGGGSASWSDFGMII